MIVKHTQKKLLDLNLHLIQSVWSACVWLMWPSRQKVGELLLLVNLVCISNNCVIALRVVWKTLWALGSSSCILSVRVPSRCISVTFLLSIACI